MRDFAKQREARGIWRLAMSLGGVVLLLIVAVVAVRAAWGMYGKFAEAAQSDELAQKEFATLQVQQVQMTTSVNSFNSSRGLEGQIRERYGVVKPGEGQIQIVREAASTTQGSLPAKNIFIRAWEALFGWL